jgi:hypothetical protein
MMVKREGVYTAWRQRTRSPDHTFHTTRFTRRLFVYFNPRPIYRTGRDEKFGRDFSLEVYLKKLANKTKNWREYASFACTFFRTSSILNQKAYSATDD